MRAARTARGPGALALVLVVGLLLAAAGCGDGGGDGTTGGAPAGDRLVIVRDDGEGTRRRSVHDCDDDPGVCAAVRAVLAEQDDRACTQIYGGPERILVEGTLDGRRVDLEITRRDGCEIARYDRVSDAVAEAGA